MLKPKIPTSRLSKLRFLSMKKRGDPRHKMRVKTVQDLFEKSFHSSSKTSSDSRTAKILTHLKKIDKLIAVNAPAWPINQIAPLDLATLRLAIWELLFAKKKEPYKVIIDEAVEIAKEYSGETSASFINGVLGTIIKSAQKENSKVKNV